MNNVFDTSSLRGRYRLQVPLGTSAVYGRQLRDAFVALKSAMFWAEDFGRGQYMLGRTADEGFCAIVEAEPKIRNSRPSVPVVAGDERGRLINDEDMYDSVLLVLDSAPHVESIGFAVEPMTPVTLAAWFRETAERLVPEALKPALYSPAPRAL